MLSPFPARRDLFLLAAGLVLGVVLGPPVLGTLSPAAYVGLFGGTEAATALDEVNEQAALARAQAKEQLGLEPEFQPRPAPLAGADGAAGPAGPDGADGVAADPARARAEAQYRQVDEVLARTQQARARAVQNTMDAQAVEWLLGLLMALAAVFVAEVLVAPEPPVSRGGSGGSGGSSERGVVVPPALRRLVTIRYALLAVALTLVLARTTLYELVPWPFVFALLAVATVAAWAPLGRREPAADKASPQAQAGKAAADSSPPSLEATSGDRPAPR